MRIRANMLNSYNRQKDKRVATGECRDVADWLISSWWNWCWKSSGTNIFERGGNLKISDKLNNYKKKFKRRLRLTKHTHTFWAGQYLKAEEQPADTSLWSELTRAGVMSKAVLALLVMLYTSAKRAVMSIGQGWITPGLCGGLYLHV